MHLSNSSGLSPRPWHILSAILGRLGYFVQKNRMVVSFFVLPFFTRIGVLLWFDEQQFVMGRGEPAHEQRVVLSSFSGFFYHSLGPFLW